MAIKVVQEYYLVVVICQSSHVQGRVDQVYIIIHYTQLVFYYLKVLTVKKITMILTCTEKTRKSFVHLVSK